MGYAAVHAEVYHENIDGKYQLYVDNDEFCPITIRISYDLNNMQIKDSSAFFVIPAHTKKFWINTISKKEMGKFSFKYYTRAQFGDQSTVNYDKEFEYYLPYEKGARHRIFQGYDGKFSHKNQKALDFNFKSGTTICAARGGVIVDIIDEYSDGCGKPECAKFNNRIVVYHNDGTFGRYLHIQHKGALVSVGDTVKIGQPIAKSGNTGYSTRAHLHFSVCYYNGYKKVTIETKFKTGEGDKAELLKTFRSYARRYD